MCRSMADISLARVATPLKSGWIFYWLCDAFAAKSAGERILKIGQDLAKLETRNTGTFFTDMKYYVLLAGFRAYTCGSLVYCLLQCFLRMFCSEFTTAKMSKIRGTYYIYERSRFHE